MHYVGFVVLQSGANMSTDRTSEIPGSPVQSILLVYTQPLRVFVSMIPIKRIVDLLIGLTLFLLTGPLVLFVMILVKITSPGPAIYNQIRLGIDGVEFPIHKIRTMWADAEKHSGPRWSTPGDERITPLGNFLRKSHLDELPQLWNVLKGEMSLVGPRPERPVIADRLEVALPEYRLRLAIKPGVTGLAQVQLPPDSDLESVRVKLICDRAYIRSNSVWLDVRLIFCTALGLFGLKNARIRGLLRIPSLEEIECASRLSQAELSGLSTPHVQAAY